MPEIKGFSYYVQDKSKILVKIFQGDRKEDGTYADTDGYIIVLDELKAVDGVSKKSALVYAEQWGDNKK